ncbi:nuclear receptor coactivator 6 isoform X3 [Tachysurus ichikawai]
MQPIVNSQMAAAARRMPHPEIGQGTTGMAPEDASGTPNLQERSSVEMAPQAGNASQQNIVNQGPNSHLLKSVPSSVPQQPGASPQQPPQQAPMAGSHNLHFPNAPSTSQSSRPKTPNRASPRPYHHPLTPTNRPPSTEPSEINLSPERLNASIAGLFPPKINIPLPPRQPNLTRGFDQQGLNPTTLKAIGQAPPNLASLNNSNSSGHNSVQQGYTQANNAASTGAKQEKQTVGGQTKRASPSNSRRSSPASNRKTATPSPGRQKWAKNPLTSIANQQQMASSQTVMSSASSVLPSPTTSISSVGTFDSQQILNPLQALPSNSDAMRESQGQVPQLDTRQITQVERDHSALRMANQRMPTQETKIQEPNMPSEQPSDELRQPQNPPLQEHGPAVSASFRDAPTSLNQLLDNMGHTKPPMVTPPVALVEQESQRISSTPQSSDCGLPLPTSEHEQKSKVGSMASPNVIQTSSLSPQSSLGVSSISPSLLTSTASNSILHPNPSVSSVTKPITSMSQTVLHRPTSSGSTQPKQITVFVTSNPISSAASTVSAVPPAIVSTVLAVPTKSIRSPDVHQSVSTQNRPPQFITGPVIFQVPSVSVPPSTNVVSQPVTMVGPIQVTANIQFSSAPVSTAASTLSAPMATHSPVVSIATSQPGRAMIGQIQVQMPASPASSLNTVHPPQQKSISDAPVSKSSPVGQSSSLHSNTTPGISPSVQQPLGSLPPCSSSGTTAVAHRSPLSQSPTTIAKSSPVQNVLAKTTPHSQMQQQTTNQSGKPIDTASSQALLQVITNATLSSPPPTPTAVSSAPQLSALVPTVSLSAPVHIPPPVSSCTVTPSPSQITPSSAVEPQSNSASSSPPITCMSAPSVPPNASVPPVTPATSTGPEARSSPLLPTVEPQPSTVTETSLPESANTTVPAADIPAQPAQEQQQTVEAAPSVAEQGWAKKRKTPIDLAQREARGHTEKVKGPSRRSSRAEKDTEEEVPDNGQRKRAARPGSASSNPGKAAESNTGASPTQAKRRKSK